MKIKIIDLLNKIANGEEVPKKIKYNSEVFIFNENYKRYINDDSETLGEFLALDLVLNNEVEIIGKEKEIKECDVLEHCVDFSKNENVLLNNQLRLQDKVNELIDIVNEIRKEK